MRIASVRIVLHIAIVLELELEWKHLDLLLLLLFTLLLLLCSEQWILHMSYLMSRVSMDRLDSTRLKMESNPVWKTVRLQSAIAEVWVGFGPWRHKF